MERKSCCCSGRSTYVATNPKKKPVVVETTKKEENAKPQIVGSEEPTVLAAAGVPKPAKSEPKDTMAVIKQERVKVNVGASGGFASFK